MPAVLAGEIDRVANEGGNASLPFLQQKMQILVLHAQIVAVAASTECNSCVAEGRARRLRALLRNGCDGETNDHEPQGGG